MKEFTIDHLKDVQTISLDRARGTIKLSTSHMTDGDDAIDLGCGDNKASGFNPVSFLFVVKLIQAITGCRFRVISDHSSGVILFQRQLPPSPQRELPPVSKPSKPIEYQCGRCGARITAQTEEMARTLRTLHVCR